MILDKFGKDYVFNPEIRSVNLDNYLKFLTEPPLSKRVTPAGSFTLSTVYSCIRLLADAIAMTPFGLFRQQPGEPEVTQIFDGPLARLTKQASGLFNNFTFWQSMIASLNGWGNAFAVIIRSTDGSPQQLIYLTPYMVNVYDTTDPRYRFLAGEVPYVYQVSTGQQTFFVRPEDMVHLTLFTYDGLWGLSPIQLHQDTLQVENEQTQYGRAFYSRGGKITGIIESPLKSTRDAAVEFVEWFNTFYGGQNSGQVAFLPNGLQFKQASVVNPQDAEWVDARKFSRQEIASIFRVPPYLLGDLERATWGNVSQLSEEFVRYSLQPIYTLIEVELNRKLLDNAQTLYYRFDPTILLRGTTTERFANYAVAVTNGFMSRSEVREKENLPYVSELDEFLQMPGSTSATESSAQVEELQRMVEFNQGSITQNSLRMVDCQRQLTSMAKLPEELENGLLNAQLGRDNLNDELEEIRDLLVAKDKHISELKGSLAESSTEINNLYGQLTLREEHLGELTNRVTELTQIAATATQAVAELKEFARIEKMRSTKHQNAINELREWKKGLSNLNLEQLVTGG